MNNQSGNALFLILIAVALFAALSYAVTQSGRGGGDINREQDSLTAAQILQQASLYKHKINRLKLINNCTDDEISFERDGSTAYVNPGSPGDRCKVFHPAGAGMNYNKPNADWLDNGLSGQDSYGDWVFVAERVRDVGTNCSAEECSDLMVILPYVTKSLCLELNRSMGVPEYSGEPPLENNIFHVREAHYFTGAGSWLTYHLTGDQGRDFDGERTACVEGGSTPSDQTGQYFFYHVLIAR